MTINDHVLQTSRLLFITLVGVKLCVFFIYRSWELNRQCFSNLIHMRNQKLQVDVNAKQEETVYQLLVEHVQNASGRLQLLTSREIKQAFGWHANGSFL